MSIADDRYLIRRKVLTIFGAKFHVYDGHGKVIGFSKQKAFKLKEDIRFFADETMAEEKLLIQARQVVDFAAAYDVVDSATGAKLGACRRKGWTSILRDSWEILDENDTPIAKVQEDSALKATLRRFLSNLIPQHYHIRDKRRSRTGEPARPLQPVRLQDGGRDRAGGDGPPRPRAGDGHPDRGDRGPAAVAARMVEVECERCGRFFEADDALAGGLTNCPGCGRAAGVPGLRDAWFRGIQVGMVVLWAFATAIAFVAGGLVAGLSVAAGLALLLLIAYVAM